MDNRICLFIFAVLLIILLFAGCTTQTPQSTYKIQPTVTESTTPTILPTPKSTNENITSIPITDDDNPTPTTQGLIWKNVTVTRPKADFTALGWPSDSSDHKVQFDASISEGSDLDFEWSINNYYSGPTKDPIKNWYYKGLLPITASLKVTNPHGSDIITKRIITEKGGRIIIENISDMWLN